MTISELVPSALSHAVALEVQNDSATVFQRINDTVSSQKIPFQPFILLQDAILLNGLNGHFEIIPFEGDGALNCMAVFPDLKTFETAKKYLRQVTGFTPGSPNAPYLALPDTVQQCLILRKIRLFDQMEFQNVRRLQLDIETLHEEGFDFPNAEREGDAIAILCLSDNTGWEHAISLKDHTEKELLEEFVRVIQERDPDIIEGHNLFRFDLPYIETRAKRHKVKLALGRDGSVPTHRASRFNVAERTINYTRYNVWGRHVIDTYHLALFYDAINRDLDGYGLKVIARHFHVAAPDRVYLDAKDMNHFWRTDPDHAIEYCFDDVRETRAVSDILSPSIFYQTRLIPLSYQNCVVRGNATRIDSIFLAEYIHARRAMPRGERARPFSGALTRSFEEGVFNDVGHCDVRSLYPSILLAGKQGPKNDSLGVFLKFLQHLRTFRLEAKDAMKRSQGSAYNYYKSLQAAFKILINSFYGYLGFEQGFLCDFSLAETVTARGREILTGMLCFLESSGARVLEMDTDGIYFQRGDVPAGELERKLPATLPPGIEVDFDESYAAMFCYKSKNYALLKQNGDLVITGAALKSRGLEPFQRNYIRSAILALLHKDHAELFSLGTKFERAIRDHSFPLSDFAKSETLSDSLENYAAKLKSGEGRRSAAYEVAIASGKEFRQGDQVFFYITGNKKRVAVADAAKMLSENKDAIRDENVEYYLAKLDELRKKFEPFADAGDSLFL